jgi:hypothetical protein
MTDPTKAKTLKFDEMDEKQQKDLIAVLYALMIIRRETGHGTLVIEVKDGEIADMMAQHRIKPKYLN